MRGKTKRLTRPRKEKKRGKKPTVTADMLDTLKEKNPEKKPATLEERIIEFVKRYAKYPARKEDSMILIINTLLRERGKKEMTTDVEDILRQVYRMVRREFPDPTV